MILWLNHGNFAKPFQACKAGKGYSGVPGRGSTDLADTLWFSGEHCPEKQGPDCAENSGKTLMNRPRTPAEVNVHRTLVVKLWGPGRKLGPKPRLGIERFDEAFNLVDLLVYPVPVIREIVPLGV